MFDVMILRRAGLSWTMLCVVLIKASTLCPQLVARL
jgi:hypothetical protein